MGFTFYVQKVNKNEFKQEIINFFTDSKFKI